jgi:hypothetical protein
MKFFDKKITSVDVVELQDNTFDLKIKGEIYCPPYGDLNKHKGSQWEPFVSGPNRSTKGQFKTLEEAKIEAERLLSLSKENIVVWSAR